MNKVQIWYDPETGQYYAVVIDNTGTVRKAAKIDSHEFARCLNGVINSRKDLVTSFNNRSDVKHEVIDSRIYLGPL